MKNLTKTIAIVAAAMLLVGCNSQTKITGELGTAWAGDSLFVVPITAPDSILASGVTDKDGAFAFTFDGTQPAICQIVVEKADRSRELGVLFVLEPGSLHFTVVDNDLMAKGTANAKRLQKLRVALADYRKQMDALYEQWRGAANVIERKEIEHAFDSNYVEYTATCEQFVRNNLNNGAGVLVFVTNDFTEEFMREIVSEAGEKFLNFEETKKVITKLEEANKIAVGKMFTDFAMRNLEGDVVRLSDFAGKGKYLVVDFWASWCGPCRRAMPELKDIFEKYAAEIDIVGVSLDNDEAKWKACVENLELPWYHMSDLKGWKCVGAQIYQVNSIPHLMLLDAEGHIVARGLDDDGLAEKLEEIFGK